MTKSRIIAGKTSAKYQADRREALDLTRFTVEVSRSCVEDMETVMDYLEMRTKSEFVRRAVSAMYTISLRTEGKLFFRRDDGSEVEVMFL